MIKPIRKIVYKPLEINNKTGHAYMTEDESVRQMNIMTGYNKCYDEFSTYIKEKYGDEL